MQREYDVIVAGAGIVGAAIAYGLAGYDKRVLMLDGADTDYRAAKANFGLVWVHGKGTATPSTTGCRRRRLMHGRSLLRDWRQRREFHWTTKPAPV